MFRSGNTQLQVLSWWKPIDDQNKSPVKRGVSCPIRQTGATYTSLATPIAPSRDGTVDGSCVISDAIT